LISLGQGPPLVVIPGIQGRWEWMRPSIDALAATHRVLTFSLGEVGNDGDWFNAWERYIDEALDRLGLPAVALVGVSFGGLIALRYAARRPERVRALVLVSTPAPDHVLDAQRAAYVRRPRSSAPLFAWRGLRRLLPELRKAHPELPARLRTLGAHLGRIVRYPPSPARMAAWVHAWDAARDELCRQRVAAPTLLITGEPTLDRVVQAASTLRYLDLIPGAQHATIRDTGHLGVVVRPGEFARIVTEFLERT
jgi:pimeloyl-ACP methyl ester carboxylesterase